jgi:probable phosphoglycerate mutase
LNTVAGNDALFVVRHGETVWNSVGRYQGARDSPLTERGREQAHSVARVLVVALAHLETPIRTFVSPLGRARETADIIGAAIPLDVAIEPRIAEVSLGAWDGLSLYEIEAEYPDALAGSDQHDWYFRAPDGESFDAALTRVSGFLEDARAPALVVTHGLASRLIRGAYEGLARRDMLRLPVPQDGFHRLASGRCEWVPAA